MKIKELESTVKLKQQEVYSAFLSCYLTLKFLTEQEKSSLVTTEKVQQLQTTVKEKEEELIKLAKKLNDLEVLIFSSFS